MRVCAAMDSAVVVFAPGCAIRSVAALCPSGRGDVGMPGAASEVHAFSDARREGGRKGSGPSSRAAFFQSLLEAGIRSAYRVW